MIEVGRSAPRRGEAPAHDSAQPRCQTQEQSPIGLVVAAPGLPLRQLVGGQVGHLVDVRARRKRPLAGAGEDDDGDLVVRHRLPYADATSLDSDELAVLHARREPLVFSHSLVDQVGGQIDAGLRLTALVEDDWPDQALSVYAPPCLATLYDRSRSW